MASFLGNFFDLAYLEDGRRPSPKNSNKNTYCMKHQQICGYKKRRIPTVDGKNPAPPGMYETL